MKRAADHDVQDATAEQLKARVRLIVNAPFPLYTALESQDERNRALRDDVDTRIRQIFANFRYPESDARPSSLSSGAWGDVVQATGENDRFWDSVVAALHFPDMRDPGQPLTLQQMRRVLGQAKMTEMEKYLKRMGDTGGGGSVDHIVSLRRLFTEYLVGYATGACLNFLILFGRYLALRRGPDGQAGSLLVPIAEHMQHKQANAVPSTQQNVTRGEYAEDAQYQFITTLELYRDSVTRRFLFYQEREDDGPQPFCLQQRNVAHSLQRIIVAGRALRLLKFYHDGYLLLHLWTTQQEVFLKVNVSDLSQITRRDDVVRLRQDDFTDCFFIDADARPYDTVFCTTQRGAQRMDALADSKDSKSLRVLSLAALASAPAQENTTQAGSKPLNAAQKLAAERLRKDIAAKETQIKELEDKLTQLETQHARAMDVYRVGGGPKPTAVAEAEYALKRPRTDLNALKKQYAPLVRTVPTRAPLFDPFVPVRDNSGLYYYPASSSDVKAGIDPVGEDQKIMHCCKVVSVPRHRAQTTHVMVASLVEDPLRSGEQRRVPWPVFSLVVQRYRRKRGDSGDYVPHGEPWDFSLRGLIETQYVQFHIDDFELLFINDDCFCVQAQMTVELEAEASLHLGDTTRQYRTASSQSIAFDFTDLYVDEDWQPQRHPQLQVIDRICASGFRLLRLESRDRVSLKYDFLFYGAPPSNIGGDVCRFIFMKLDLESADTTRPKIPTIYWLDVQGVQAQHIIYLTAENTYKPGYLYLCVDAEVMGARQRQLLHVTGRAPMDEYDANTTQWHLRASMARLSLNCGGGDNNNNNTTPSNAGHCTLCALPTEQQDSLSRQYYCDALCQTLYCHTGRLL